MTTTTKGVCRCGAWRLPLMSTAICMPPGQKLPEPILTATFVVTIVCPACGLHLRQVAPFHKSMVMTLDESDTVLSTMAAMIEQPKGTPS